MLIDRQRLQARHIARQFLRESDQLAAEYWRENNENHRQKQDENDENDERCAEPVEAEALQPLHDRVKQIA